MRKNLATTLGALITGAMLALPGGIALAQNQPAGHREPHPTMRRAIRQLERVKEELQQDAARDFSGHRAQAVQDIDQAIAQLKEGIASDPH
jgi:hypothetical protein